MPPPHRRVQGGRPQNSPFFSRGHQADDLTGTPERTGSRQVLKFSATFLLGLEIVSTAPEPGGPQQASCAHLVVTAG